jgi:hypothetical protein
VTRVIFSAQEIARDCHPVEEWPQRTIAPWPLLILVRLLQHFFLDFHVSELVGVEYLTTIQTFDVFNVLFTRYHADFWVFAGGVHLGDLSV